MKPNGYVLWQGPSAINGDPIVVIATGLAKASSNSKTGGMVQTYILRQDMEPHVAVKHGFDNAICGDCPHRGNGIDGSGRTCYVNLGQGPLSVYRAYRAGRYPVLPQTVESGEWSMFQDKAIRMGTYGDPAAAPAWVWFELAKRAKRWTGYTHQWRKLGGSLKELLMASVDTEEEKEEAKAMGFRTFRTAPVNKTTPGEILCPASKEAGHRTLCAKCGLCAGARKVAADIMIPIHGSYQVHNKPKLAARLAQRQEQRELEAALCL